MNSQDLDIKVVDEALQKLREYFDSVQILCTRYESTEGGTINIQKGDGDWFARYGMAKKYALKCDEELRQEVVAPEE